MIRKSRANQYMILQHITTAAKDRLNEIMFHSDNANTSKYVMSTLTDFNYELNALQKMTDPKLMTKIIRLLTKSREYNINNSMLPIAAKTHLLCVVQTICKEHIRDLMPVYTVVDSTNLKIMPKWYKSYLKASICRENVMGKLGVNCAVVSWNELHALKYEYNKSNK